MFVPIRQVYRAFDRFSAEYRANIALEVWVDETTGEIGQRATLVTRNQVEQLGDLRCKAADHQVAVEEYCCDTGT